MVFRGGGFRDPYVPCSMENISRRKPENCRVHAECVIESNEYARRRRGCTTAGYRGYSLSHAPNFNPAHLLHCGGPGAAGGPTRPPTSPLIPRGPERGRKKLEFLRQNAQNDFAHRQVRTIFSGCLTSSSLFAQFLRCVDHNSLGIRS